MARTIRVAAIARVVPGTDLPFLDGTGNATIGGTLGVTGLTTLGTLSSGAITSTSTITGTVLTGTTSVIAPFGSFGENPAASGTIRLPYNGQVLSNDTAQTGAIGVFGVGISVSNAIEIGFATAAASIIMNAGNGDTNFIVRSDTNINSYVHDAGLFSGYGAHTFGAANLTNPNGYVSIRPGAHTTVANQSYGHFFVAPSAAITVPTGTSAVVSSAWFAEPNITATGTVTQAATVYIANAPTEGTDNFALLIDGDTSNVDLHGGAVLAQDATDGFVFIPRLTGAPLGAPRAIKAGNVAMCYDINNNALKIHNGIAWRTINTV